MKYFLIVISLMFCCSIHAQNKKNKTKKKTTEKTAVAPTSTTSSERYTVSGKVMQTFPYCGGAAPSEEMMKSLRAPKPYGGKIFYIRKGSVNDLKAPIMGSFTVNGAGEFSFELPPGTYSIIQKEQLKTLDLKQFKSGTWEKADENCLKEWWAKPYHLLEIKDKNLGELSFIFHRKCFVNSDIPCIYYRGPMPP